MIGGPFRSSPRKGRSVGADSREGAFHGGRVLTADQVASQVKLIRISPFADVQGARTSRRFLAPMTCVKVSPEFVWLTQSRRPVHIPRMPRPGLRKSCSPAALATFRAGFNATSVQTPPKRRARRRASFYKSTSSSKEALPGEAGAKVAERGRPGFALLRKRSFPPLRRLRKYFESLTQAVVSPGSTHGCSWGTSARAVSQSGWS